MFPREMLGGRGAQAAQHCPAQGLRGSTVTGSRFRHLHPFSAIRVE